MGWSDIFYGIQDLHESIFIAAFDSIRFTEDQTSWWLANAGNFIFMAICAVAIGYWLGELKKYNDEDTEDREAKAHGFLGKNSELEHKL